MPTDSADVGLNTRSMCRNRSGRPRSCTRKTTEAIDPPPATSRRHPGQRRPAAEVGQRSQDRRRARRPAEEQVERHVRRLPHRRLDDRAAVVRRELGLVHHRDLAGGPPPAAPPSLAVALALPRAAVGPAPAGTRRREIPPSWSPLPRAEDGRQRDPDDHRGALRRRPSTWPAGPARARPGPAAGRRPPARRAAGRRRRCRRRRRSRPARTAAPSPRPATSASPAGRRPAPAARRGRRTGSTAWGTRSRRRASARRSAGRSTSCT